MKYIVLFNLIDGCEYRQHQFTKIFNNKEDIEKHVKKFDDDIDDIEILNIKEIED